MIKRDAEKKIIELASTFKSVAITGARQTGKTTLVRKIFDSKPYVSLENPDVRQFATEDPRGFLDTYSAGAIFDEIQRTPLLFSYIQEILDDSNEKGKFIFTGSNNFLLQENISQTLAGRTAYFHLLPLTIGELNHSNILIDDDNVLMLKGFYPPVYDQDIPYKDWAINYIRTYIERDVRQIKSISNLDAFVRCLKLLAGRTGQELNYSSLAVEVGVDVKTIQSWISIMESSFIIFLLKPHHKNFNKTVVKRPKIYFYDTSIVCSLLGISDDNQLALHPFRGAIFETMVVSELVKQRTNKGEPVNLYYWRDKSGHDIDVVIDDAGELAPLEIKSGKTVNSEYFKHLSYWSKLTNTTTGMVLYAGDIDQKRSSGHEVMNWRKYIMSKS